MDQLDHHGPHEKIKLTEINSLLTCYLCKGYLIDATAISECLHSFCRSCIIKFLEENSYCPICEVLINKAKPNLKLDKTLQDIVYKLVPGLFVKEMMRRRYFYHEHPELAQKVSPEQRGEDTERTIFNPQDEISLSIEYISDDSTPGALKVPCLKSAMDASTNLGSSNEAAEAQQIKRYLQCPGMCRVEVLKKFVRNKYQVDTNSFYIDILYKRVPLPDHYTLIDIAYIYSWKRNEPMKFYFRITDINKVAERFDCFDASKPVVDVFQPPARVRQHHHDRERTPKVRRKSLGKRFGERSRTSHNSSPRTPQGKNKNKTTREKQTEEPAPKPETEEIRNDKTDVAADSQSSDAEKRNKENIANNEDDSRKSETPKDSTVVNKKRDEESDIQSHVYTNITLNRTNNLEIITKIQQVSNKEGQPIGLNIIKQSVKKGTKVPNSTNDVDNNVSNVDNKIVPKLIIRTDADRRMTVSDSKVQNTVQDPFKQPHPKEDKKLNITQTNKTQKAVPCKETKTEGPSKENSIKIILSEPEVKKKVEETRTSPSINKKLDPVHEKNDMEKSEFLKSIQLTAKTPLPEHSELSSSKAVSAEQPVLSSSKTVLANGLPPKRKNASPVKGEKPAKKARADRKPGATKIILQAKTPIPAPMVTKMMSDVNQNANSVSKIVEQTNSKPGNPDLQSLFDSCKINIPSSLSITLKEGNENEVNNPVPIPPVKNYIQILKLPDEETDKKKPQEQKNGAPDFHQFKPESAEKAGVFSKDNNTLTVQKIKPEQSSNKTQLILPSPVPELPCKLFNIPKDSLSKLSPRTPQTFQKIFEESIKKTDGKASTGKEKNTAGSATTSEISNIGKRKILEIASQLYKKNKLEIEKQNEASISKAEEKLEKLPNITSGKVAIPRLNHKQPAKVPKKVPKFELLSNNCGPQSYASLHSNALGLNYTVSIGPSSAKPGGSNNGLLAPTKTIQLDNKSKALPSKSEVKYSTDPIAKEVAPLKPKEEDSKGKLPILDPGPNMNGQLPKTEASDIKNTTDGANTSVTSAISDAKSEPASPKPSTPVSSPKLTISSPTKAKTQTDESLVSTTQKSSKVEPSKNTVSSTPSPKLGSMSPKLGANSPRLATNSPKLGANSPRLGANSPRLGANSPRLNSPRSAVSPKSPVIPAKTPPQIKPATSSSNTSLNSNQLLEQYNIQNLAQLTASFNFNPNSMSLAPNSQLAALQQAMFLKHIEMQNRQNWYNMNQNHLIQYENYLKSLNQSHLLGNIKEN